MEQRIIAPCVAQGLLDAAGLDTLETAIGRTYNPPTTEHFVRIPGADFAVAAEVCGADGMPSEGVARLFASAPDLARSVIEQHLEFDRITDQAAAKIGESEADLSSARGEIARLRAALELAHAIIEGRGTTTNTTTTDPELAARELRDRIEAALRTRDPSARLAKYPTESDRALWVATRSGGDASQRAYTATPDLDALTGLAVAVGLNPDGTDPRDEVLRLRAEVARLTRERDDALSCETGQHAENLAIRHGITEALDYLSNVHAIGCEQPDYGRCDCDVKHAREALGKVAP